MQDKVSSMLQIQQENQDKVTRAILTRCFDRAWWISHDALASLHVPGVVCLPFDLNVMMLVQISEQSELIVKLKKEIEEAKGVEVHYRKNVHPACHYPTSWQEKVEEAAVVEAEEEEEVRCTLMILLMRMTLRRCGSRSTILLYGEIAHVQGNAHIRGDEHTSTSIASHFYANPLTLCM